MLTDTNAALNPNLAALPVRPVEPLGEMRNGSRIAEVDKTMESRDHPLHHFFELEVHRALSDTGLHGEYDAERYLVDLLMQFLHGDTIYSIRDAAGRRVESVVDMLAEGDVLLNADSFDRERQVHKHVGDFLLFWSGLYPEFLRFLKNPYGKDALVDCVAQGRESYAIAGSFEHDPYGAEAPVLRKLSAGFVEYQHSLTLVRASFEGFRRQGWIDGFSA